MKIGIADTLFAVTDMFKFAKDAIENSEEEIQIERYTVPGVKDLPVACKKLLEEHGCNICLALGMPGPMPIDKQCANQASQGIIQAQLLTNKHILEVFIHLDEANDDNELYKITKDRTEKHTINAIALAKNKSALQNQAGQGKRQGHEDHGPINEYIR